MRDVISATGSEGFFSYARTDKPNKPNTLNTTLIKILILKGFICVGFVSGSGLFVLGSVVRGKDDDRGNGSTAEALGRAASAQW
ncbi:hypothetical protein QNM99_17915 [Pseudomonas sp. PCH446]